MRSRKQSYTQGVVYEEEAECEKGLLVVETSPRTACQGSCARPPPQRSLQEGGYPDRRTAFG